MAGAAQVETMSLSIGQLEVGDIFEVPSFMHPVFPNAQVSFKVMSKTSKGNVVAQCHWFGVYVGLYEINKRGEAIKS